MSLWSIALRNGPMRWILLGGAASACSGTVGGLIIDPVNPSDSLILRKVVGGFPSPTCGGAMPVTGGELTDDQVDCVASWVRKFQNSASE